MSTPARASLTDPATPGLLAHPLRQRVYYQVWKAPGIHLRGLQRALDLPLGTVEYHVYRLVREGLLLARTTASKTAYFIDMGLERQDRDVILWLRRPMLRRVLEILLKEEESTFRGLLPQVEIAASTVSHHLNRLIRIGLVSVRREGRTLRYSVVDAKRIRTLLGLLRPSLTAGEIPASSAPSGLVPAVQTPDVASIESSV